MKRFATSWIALFMFTGVAMAQQKAPLSPKEILDRVILVYGSCTSYQDQGQALNEFSPGLSEATSFATAFVRPSSFRFDETTRWRYVNASVRSIAWKDGELEKSWPPAAWRKSQQSGDEQSSFVEAVPRAGTARIIMALLRPDLFRADNLLASLTHLELAKMEKVEGRMAFKLDAKFIGEMVSVWVDQQTFLVLKIYLEEGKKRVVTLFKPQINLPITREQLAFNPPTVPAPISGPSNIEILSFSYAKKLELLYGHLPDESGPPRAPDPPRNTLGLPDWAGPEGSEPMFGHQYYLYTLKIKNLSEKVISGIAWDYVAMDSATAKELGRQKFISKEIVKPAEIHTLSKKGKDPPSKVISAASAGATSDGVSPDHVELRCVLYKDGSWWKDPSAKENECEYFKSTAGGR